MKSKHLNFEGVTKAMSNGAKKTVCFETNRKELSEGYLLLGGRFKTFLQLSTVKQTLEDGVPGIRCHESLVTCFTAEET